MKVLGLGFTKVNLLLWLVGKMGTFMGPNKGNGCRDPCLSSLKPLGDQGFRD